MRSWLLLAAAWPLATLPAYSETPGWQIVSKATFGNADGYTGAVDDEMTIIGPNDGLRMSLIQLLFRDATVELYLNVYKCTPERDHTSTQMILWRAPTDAQTVDIIRKFAEPQMNFLLAGCGFRPIAAELFSGNFDSRFGELSGRYKAYIEARLKTEAATPSVSEPD